MFEQILVKKNTTCATLRHQPRFPSLFMNKKQNVDTSGFYVFGFGVFGGTVAENH